MAMDDRLADKQADNSSIRWSQLISQLSYSVFRGWWRHNRRQKIKRISLWWQRNKMFFHRLWAEPWVSSLMKREIWITRSVGQHYCRLHNGDLLVVCFSTISTNCNRYHFEKYISGLTPLRATNKIITFSLPTIKKYLEMNVFFKKNPI